jgi:hypothetical protein
MGVEYTSCPECGEEYGFAFQEPTPCDACEGHNAGRLQGEKYGRKSERSAIVNWLRKEAAASSLSSMQREWQLAARAIEKGLHEVCDDE